MKFATGLTVFNTNGDLSDLSIRLPANAFAPCTSLQWSSAGWVPPVADNLVERVNGARVICLRVQKKLLPAAAIKERAALEIERIEKTEGRVVSRKERKVLIEQVTDSLLPGTTATRCHLATAHLSAAACRCAWPKQRKNHEQHTKTGG